MAKLRVKDRPVTVSHIEDDTYHCCRWCHWCVKVNTDEYRCTNPCYAGSEVDTAFVVDIVEDGDLSAVLEESLHGVPDKVKEFETDMVNELHKWGVSAKRIKKFKTLFGQCLDQFLDMGLKEEIDTQVSRLLYNRAGTFKNKEKSPEAGVVISDPFTHYCREF